MPELWGPEWIRLPGGTGLHRDDSQVCRDCGSPRMTVIRYEIRNQADERIAANTVVACKTCTRHWQRHDSGRRPLWRELGEVDMRTGTVYQTEEQRHESQVPMEQERSEDRGGVGDVPDTAGPGRMEDQASLHRAPARPDPVSELDGRDQHRDPAGCDIATFPGGGRGFICRR